MALMNKEQAETFALLKLLYRGEKIFRPSNASRWMACAGSVQLSARVPRRESGTAAMEGTAAHRIAEFAMKGGPSPEEWIGRFIVIDDEDQSITWEVDDEMARLVDEYAASMDSFLTIPGTALYAEQKLSLGAIDPDDPLLAECGGTSDAIVVNQTERWIQIGDLKYGKGIEVLPTSAQVKIYLLLAFLKFNDGKPWNWFRTMIFQPRLTVPPYPDFDGWREADFNPRDFLAPFFHEVVTAMLAALDRYPSLKVGPHCDWCPARDICPAHTVHVIDQLRGVPAPMTETNMSMARPSFPDVSHMAANGQYPATSPGAIILRSPMDYSVEELSRIILAEPMIDGYLGACKHRATQLMQAGVEIPNLALDRRKRHRAWKYSRETTEQELLKLGLTATQIYEDPRMRTPPQIEKRLNRIKHAALEELYERPQGDVVLVRDQGRLPPRQPIPMFPPADVKKIPLT